MNVSKVGVTGYADRGVRSLLSRGCVPLCDVTEPAQIYNSIQQSGVEFVIHASECNGIDYCEKNQERATFVNARGTYNVVNACARQGMKMVYVSSSHVFGSKKWFGNYKETDTPNPKNFYGMTKLGAEGICNLTDDGVKIVRTSDLYGSGYLAKGLLYFVENFDKMPKILHIAAKSNKPWWMTKSIDLDVSWAIELGVPIYHD